MKRLLKLAAAAAAALLTMTAVYADTQYAEITIDCGEFAPSYTLYRIDENSGSRKMISMPPAYAGPKTMKLMYGIYEIPEIRIASEDGMYESLPLHFQVGEESDGMTVYLKYERIEPEAPHASPRTADSGSAPSIVLFSGFTGLAAASWMALRFSRK